jgi:hypothetical protein
MRRIKGWLFWIYIGGPLFLIFTAINYWEEVFILTIYITVHLAAGWLVGLDIIYRCGCEKAELRDTVWRHCTREEFDGILVEWKIKRNALIKERWGFIPRSIGRIRDYCSS